MKNTPWFILPTLALCFAFPGPAFAQSAERIDPVIRSVLIPAPAIPNTLDCISLQDLAVDVREYDLSWGSNSDTTANPEPSGRTLFVPGTIAQSSATPLKPGHISAFSVEPGSLPSWITDQPLAYLKYGAAPAVVTVHFGHK